MSNDDEGFDRLVEVMRREPRPLALLGAGASVDAGYPNWNQLLAILEAKAAGKMGPKYQSFLRTLNDPAWQAEEYRRLIGEHTFRSIIASEFGPKGKLSEVVRLVARLGFRHVLTTNYDDCIERAFQAEQVEIEPIDWSEEQNLRRFFLEISQSRRGRYLVYLHGRFHDPGNIVLTETSYAARYVRSDDASRKLFALLITQPVVFLGFSVNDPDLNHLMREVNARLGTGYPLHFAFIGYEVEEQKELIRNRFQGKYGIAPVFYKIQRTRDGGEDHGQLRELLLQLHGRITEGAPRSPSPAGRAPPPAPASAPPPPPAPAPARPFAALSFSQPAAEAAPAEAPPAVIDPLDQQKGRWGGSPKRNGRELSVENIEESATGSLCGFELVVKSTDPGKPLQGTVAFHLHQTFPSPDVLWPVENGSAVLRLSSVFGAFTVGAEADDGKTRLELDLASVAEFPRWFRER